MSESFDTAADGCFFGIRPNCVIDYYGFLKYADHDAAQLSVGAELVSLIGITDRRKLTHRDKSGETDIFFTLT